MSHTVEEIKTAVKNSISIASTCRYLGLQEKGRNFNVIKKYVEDYGIDTSHFKGRFWDTSVYGKSKPLSEILVENSKYQSSKLRNRLVDDGIKERCCESCGNTEWLGFPIPLELHHINGNHFDNRLENLKMMCPTCHSLYHKYMNNDMIQYNTEHIGISELEKELNKEVKEIKNIKPKVEKPKRYCLICGNELGRKQTKYCCYECAKKASCKRPSYDELLNIMVENEYNLTKVGRLFGVSANAIKKWCKHYNITNGSSSFIHKKKIAQYTEDNDLIEIYESIADATLKTNISTIKKSLQDNSKTAGGFIWRYVEE